MGLALIAVETQAGYKVLEWSQVLLQVVAALGMSWYVWVKQSSV